MTKRLFQISRRKLLLGSMAFTGALGVPVLATTSKEIEAIIDVGNQSPRISDKLYGGFLEHIGNLINHSLWSEVLDDRKFYYGVVEHSEPVPIDFRKAMAFNKKWTTIGPIGAISLDRLNPYVGEHSPVVTVDGSESRGITQAGLSLMPGKYTGRFVVAAERGVSVVATLYWGAGAGDQHTIRIPTARKWKTRHLQFDVPVDTTDGRLEIIAEGVGNFRIGAVSLMPNDNVKGFRSDTIKLMREMDCNILRMPGGNFISAYDWKNTIGDPDKRPPTMDPVWKAVQQNDVGVDELLQMCQLIDCEPYWCVNTGFGEPRSGAELVEYVNGSTKTPWGATRAANGYEQPYRVKYWNIGNEMYGHWQFGHMARDQYVVKHNLFADAMRAVDPEIYIIAPGGFVDEMTTGQGIFIAGQPRVEVGSERDWAYAMFKHCWGNFDALATHAYPPEGKRFDLKTGKLFDVDMSLLEWARQPANRVRTMVDAWEEYKKIFPNLNNGNVKVFFDEWAYHFKDDLKGALAIALTLHEFFRHTDFIDMAGYTMATAWFDFNRTHSTISTKGRMFQFYNRLFGSIPVAVNGNMPQPAPQFPVGGDQPATNSGSSTYPLDVSAALTADGKTLVMSIVNATENHQPLTLNIPGFKALASGRCWKFTGTNVNARNAVGKEPETEITESSFDTRVKSLIIAPISVEMYHFTIA